MGVIDEQPEPESAREPEIYLGPYIDRDRTEEAEILNASFTAEYRCPNRAKLMRPDPKKPGETDEEFRKRLKRAMETGYIKQLW
jgi:hypothetical protein